jgi:hypothetical protein
MHVIQLSRIPVLSPLKSSRDDSKSLAAGAIAGITIGALSVVFLAILVACVRRARRRQRASESALAPESYIIVNPAQRQVSNPVSISTLPSAPSHSCASISTVAKNRQEYLTAQLRTVQKQLETLQASVGTGGGHLEQAMQQNEALRARIRMLEREMQSQWGLGLSDSPPAYLD